MSLRFANCARSVSNRKLDRVDTDLIRIKAPFIRYFHSAKKIAIFIIRRKFDKLQQIKGFPLMNAAVLGYDAGRMVERQSMEGETPASDKVQAALHHRLLGLRRFAVQGPALETPHAWAPLGIRRRFRQFNFTALKRFILFINFGFETLVLLALFNKQLKQLKQLKPLRWPAGSAARPRRPLSYRRC